MSASLIGAWGIGLGVLLAWPHQVRPVRILSALSGAGILGGLLFTWAVGQRLSRAGEGPWPLLMICAWQAGLLIALAVSLGPSSRARAVAEEP